MSKNPKSKFLIFKIGNTIQIDETIEEIKIKLKILELLLNFIKNVRKDEKSFPDELVCVEVQAGNQVERGLGPVCPYSIQRMATRPFVEPD